MAYLTIIEQKGVLCNISDGRSRLETSISHNAVHTRVNKIRSTIHLKRTLRETALNEFRLLFDRQIPK